MVKNFESKLKKMMIEVLVDMKIKYNEKINLAQFV